MKKLFLCMMMVLMAVMLMVPITALAEGELPTEPFTWEYRPAAEAADRQGMEDSDEDRRVLHRADRHDRGHILYSRPDMEQRRTRRD